MLKAIIFDMDGVLLDSESVHFEVLRDMLKHHGFQYTIAHFHQYCGVIEEQMWPQLLRGTGLAHEDFVQLQREHWQIYNQVIQSKGLPKFPGIKEFLELLREDGYRMAVASSSSVQTITENLRALGIDSYFSYIASAQKCGVGKPAPDVFFLAAKGLRAVPADCMVIEDSANGMIAAYRAGMKWVGFCGAKIKPDMRYAIFTFSDYRTATPKQLRQWYDEFPDPSGIERLSSMIEPADKVLGDNDYGKCLERVLHPLSIPDLPGFVQSGGAGPYVRKIRRQNASH